MKFKLIFILSLIFTFFFVSCQADLQPTEANTQAADESLDKMAGWERAHDLLLENFLSAIKEKDLERFMTYWWNSPHTTLVLENGIIVRGWDNIYAGVGMLFEQHETLDLEVHQLERYKVGNSIIGVGIATWTRVLKPEYGGGTTQFTEVWTDVASFVDGRLVYVIDHPHDLTPFGTNPLAAIQ